MTQKNPSPRFPPIPDISERDSLDQFHREELHLKHGLEVLVLVEVFNQAAWR